MKKTLESLVRLSKFEVDERRRELKVVQEEEDRLYSEISKIEDRVQSEKLTATKQPEYAQAYSRFLIWARREKNILEGKITALQPLLEHARDNLASAFAELKKAELTRDNRALAEEAENNKKDQMEMDELAMDRHRRSAGS